MWGWYDHPSLSSWELCENNGLFCTSVNSGGMCLGISVGTLGTAVQYGHLRQPLFSSLTLAPSVSLASVSAFFFLPIWLPASPSLHHHYDSYSLTVLPTFWVLKLFTTRGNARGCPLGNHSGSLYKRWTRSKDLFPISWFLAPMIMNHYTVSCTLHYISTIFQFFKFFLNEK